MLKKQDKNATHKNPFKVDVKKVTAKSVESKRNKDGIIMIDKKNTEGKEWYYHS